MDLIAIVGGMVIGGFGGLILSNLMPGTPPEVSGVLALIGTVIGGVIGYSLVWSAKENEMPKQKVVSRPIRPQIAGSQCKKCEERIILMVDGVVCDRCMQVYCKVCEPNIPCSSCDVPVDAELVVEASDGSG